MARITKLILTRHAGESIMIGDSIKITLNRSPRNGLQGRITVEAPEDLKIVRSELLPGGWKGPATGWSDNAGNYIDPRGDRDLDAEAGEAA